MPASHTATPPPEPRIVEYALPADRVDVNAIKVVRRLVRHGYESYLVGGCIRDLVAGLSPKDFDVATAARPSQVKRLFRNCWLIGRRFRLAHVIFRQRQVIEVATFRTRPPGNGEAAPADGHEPDLLIREDNVFGEPWEDAHRRDFTCNALFYDLDRERILDYVGGYQDLEAGVIRSIGDPEIRFREDPVRMLRACKYAAKLGFSIDPDSVRAIVACRDEIGRSSPSRLTEELFKILGAGAARATLCCMLEYRLLKGLSPSLAQFLDSEPGRWGWQGERHGPGWDQLRALDAEVQTGRAPSRAVQLACLVVPMARPPAAELVAEAGLSRREALRQSADLVLTALALNFRLPRRDKERVRLVATAQERLRPPPDRPINPGRLLNRDYFLDALAFLRLECLASGEGWEYYAYWRQRSATARRHLPPPPVDLPVELAPGPPPRRRRRRRRSRRGRRSKRPHKPS